MEYVTGSLAQRLRSYTDMVRSSSGRLVDAVNDARAVLQHEAKMG